MSDDRSRQGRLGILAGRGELPWIAARAALRAGEEPRLFLFTDEAPPAELAPLCEDVVLTRFYSSFLRALEKNRIRRLLLIGKATRDILYNRPRFDLRTLFLIARMASQSDFSLFRRLAGIVEERGIEIIPQDLYLGALRLSPGRYGPKLKPAQLADALFGLHHAAEINRLDIGQTVVVGDLAVLAVEAAEGTDQCIRRGGALFRGRGATVCKLAKEDHDPRFDLPVTGLSTLESMAESGCRLLVFEHQRTFVVDPPAFLARARKASVTVLSVDRSQINAAYLRRLNSREARFSGGRV